MVYSGSPAMTVWPPVTKTSCTVPLWVRVMAACSLARALPCPDTLLWMVPIWAVAGKISPTVSSVAVRKRYRAKPPPPKITAATPKAMSRLMIFRLPFPTGRLTGGLGGAGGAASTGAAVS